MPIDRAVPRTVLIAAVEILAVQVGHLLLGDVLDLLRRHRADLVAVRLGRSLGQVRDLLQQHRRRRRLGDEGVAAVGEDRDDDRDDQAFVLRRPRVEVLAEVHDVDAVRTERGPDRRRGRRLARGNLQLHHRLNFFRHNPSLGESRLRRTHRLSACPARIRAQIFSTCRKSSSTGVARPKIVTITFSVFLSRFTSSTTPLKLVNGPSLIRT